MLQSIHLLVQRKDEFQASGMAVLYRNCTLMEQHGILHNRQTKTCATHLARATFINSVESFEQAINVLLAHPYSIISKHKPIIFRRFFKQVYEYVATA